MNDLKRLFDKEVSVEYIPSDIIPNKHGETRAIYFETVPYFGKKTTTFAYFGIPKLEMPEGGYPAVVLVHGGGGCAFYEWVEYWNGKGYAAVSFDCSGRQFGSLAHDGKNDSEANPNGRFLEEPDNGSYSNNAEDIKDSWTYHNVANIILINNILRADERINKDKICLTGVSWGGVLTALSSGIDDRFAAFAPVYGTGYLLERESFRRTGRALTMERSDWESLYDVQSYTVSSVKPMLHTLGMDDWYFNCAAAKKTYDVTRCKMMYSYRRSLDHYHRWKDEEQMLHISKFLDLCCSGIPLPFEVKEESESCGVFSVKVTSPENIEEAYFTYTKSEGGEHTDWIWETEAQSVQGDTFTMNIPEGIKYYFLELRGEDGDFILSSSMHKG